MKVFDTSKKMRGKVINWHNVGETVCLVPTMGSIHAGHLALINKAKDIARRVVVSIYINPKQFAADEDFERYPRNLQADEETIRAVGNVDAIYAPHKMYCDDHATNIVPSGAALPMEGVFRSNFFTGVATVVFKLFQQVPADYAVFGEKDFQQFAVLRKMVEDMDLQISLTIHPTVRENDGLAMSSRNYYLSASQRKTAPELYKTLTDCAKEIRQGCDFVQALDKAKANILRAGFDKIDYLDLRDPISLASSTIARSDDRLFVAAWLGKTRLIDNCKIGSS